MHDLGGRLDQRLGDFVFGALASDLTKDGADFAALIGVDAMARDAIRAEMAVDEGLAARGVAAVGEQLIRNFRTGHLEAGLRSRVKVLLQRAGDAGVARLLG